MDESVRKMSVELILSKPEALKKFTVLLGKNASGKSAFLTKLRSNDKIVFHYLTPERGGKLLHNTAQSDKINKNRYAYEGEKYQNQHTNFHELSMASFVHFLSTSNNEIVEAHGIDNAKADKLKQKKEGIIEIINTLIPEHKIVVSKQNIVSFQKNESNLETDHLSSGSSQVYSIIFDIAYFLLNEENTSDKNIILLLDEPDAHLHPDLQYKLIQVINEFIKNNDKVKCIIATHSTSILSALSSLNKKNTDISFIQSGKTEHELLEINEILDDIVPIFGAHPLTQVFNEYPAVLLEGEDDVFVFQTAIKSSRTKDGVDVIKLYPCDCGGIDNIKKYEDTARKLLSSIYDNPKIYSFMDRDDSVTEPTDEDTPIKIMRSITACREMENLVLSDQVLESIGSNWEKAEIVVKKLISEFTGRYSADIKNNVYKIISEIKPDNGKSWEILVGRAIGQNITKANELVKIEGSIFHMLGEKSTSIILGKI